MSWNSPSEFFAMGGYGLYVWGSYAVAVVCIAGELWLVRQRRRALEVNRGAGEIDADGSSRQP